MKQKAILTLSLAFVCLCFYMPHILFASTANKKILFSYTSTPQSNTRLKITKKAKLAFFDSAQHEKYRYKTMLEIAKASNFTIDYYPLHKILDLSIDQIPFEKYDCSFFILCPEMLKTMHKSPVAQKILTILKKSSQSPNKMVGLMFPSIKLAHKNPMLALAPLFKQLETQNLSENQQRTQSHMMFSHVVNRFLQMPFEYRPISYHTTLSMPHTGSSFNAKQTISGGIMPLALLPLKKNSYPSEIKNLFPFGIYWFNPAKNNHLIISNNSLCSFSGITENFQICPMDFALRKKMLDAISEMMWEIYQITTQEQQQGIDTHNILNSQKNNLPLLIQSLGTTRKSPSTIKPLKVAWMELEPFSAANKEKNKKERQKLLVKFVSTAGLDSLWITLNPNMYYSPIAKSKNQTNSFLQSLSNFTKQLKKESNRQNIKPPSILIGFEITNNIYPPNLPVNPAKDIYGNIYPDIPAPLDKTFWHNEIKMPLKAFLEEWKKPKISNTIPLAGIVIDLEMYCRKATGTFLPTMGFNTNTIAQFKSGQVISTEQFPQYLMEHKQAAQYFSFLEKKAEQLGANLYSFFKTEIPNGIIGCYAPNISIDWFYKGLYKGLSKPKRPLHLFTFNAEFDSHKQWLLKNNIQARHYGVLMLSKLTTKQDFHYLNTIIKHHDGVWLNRFSRIAEPPHNDWSNLEQTPLSMEKRVEFTRHLKQAWKTETENTIKATPLQTKVK